MPVLNFAADPQQLVSFVQHRDPRYKAYMATAAQRKAENAARREAPASKRTQQKAPAPPPQEEFSFEEQDWQKLSGVELGEIQEGAVGSVVEENEGDTAFECVACNKTFLSERTWANHERSKKHKQAVWRLRKEMELEDEEIIDEALESDGDGSLAEFADLNLGESPAQPAEPPDIESAEDEQPVLERPATPNTNNVAAEEATPPTLSSQEKSATDEPICAQDPASRVDDGDSDSTDSAEELETSSRRRQKGSRARRTREQSPAPSSSALETPPPELSKRDKRRAREAKKKAEAEPQKKEPKSRSQRQEAVPEKLVPTGKQGKSKQQDRRKAQTKAADVDEVELKDRAVRSINEKRDKLKEKWADDWTSESHRSGTCLS